MVTRAVVIATLLAVRLGAQETTESARVQYGVRVLPETVTVGDPLRIVVRVRAPVGAEIAFPADPDTTGALHPRDPRTVRTARDTAALDQTATYTLSAWDVDSQFVRLTDVVVRIDGVERRIPLGRFGVYVRSVLPADTAQRVPKPPRPLIEPRIWPWWLLALIAAAIVALLLLAWWWRRRKRRALIVPIDDPYARAQHEFARIDALKLPEAGEPGRHVALAVDVVRDYLAARLPGPSRSHTTTELILTLRGSHAVPRERLAHLLAEADLVKFARSPVSRDHAYELSRESTALVDEVERRHQAEEAAARAREAESRAAPNREAAA